MAMTLHLEHGSRSAKLALHGLPASKPKPKLQQRSAVGEVGSWRIANGIQRQAEGFEALRDGDPELDLALAGTEIDSDETNPAWFDAAASEPVPIGDFADIDIVFGPDGEEKTRRPHLVRRPNLDELHPVKLGKRMPMAEALTGFAFKQMLQLAHTDGLSFEFLRDLAADLAQVGSRVADRVVHREFVPYADALRSMRAMHGLVLVNSPDSRDSVFVPGKLYDYLMARRPVLFVGSPGDASHIVERCGGCAFEYGSARQIAATLTEWIDAPAPRLVDPVEEFDPQHTFAPLLDRLA